MSKEDGTLNQPRNETMNAQQYTINGKTAPELTERAGFKTRSNGDLEGRYECYLTFADDGKGGDITRGGAPLLTFEEWLEA